MVKLVLSEASGSALGAYAEAMGFSRKSEYHSTIFYSRESPLFKNPVLEEGLRRSLPILVDSTVCSAQIFGEGDLVLAHNDRRIIALREYLIQEAVRQCVHGYFEEEPDPKRLGIIAAHLSKRDNTLPYPLQPHVTIVKSFKGNVSQIQIPQIDLVYDQYEWEEN